ncbi:hypothetical protein Celaphus_00002537, partial [Cervus elaphus hippelaphus]
MGNLVEVPGVSPLRQSHPFLNSWLDCNEEQAKDPKLPLQHCFMATVTAELAHTGVGLPQSWVGNKLPNKSIRNPLPQGSQRGRKQGGLTHRQK